MPAPTEFVPIAVVDGTRALLWVRTGAEARRLAEELVSGLGGTVVPASNGEANALPADIAFGDGEPLLAAAGPGSEARALLDRYLVPFLLDARRALQLSARTERLDEDASTDALTGLPNRRTLERGLGRLLAGDTVIMLDLDHFKRVNDEFGHQTGDEVLVAFGKALRGVVRAPDFVGRFGGEEFVVILSPMLGAEIFLLRLRDKWLAERPLPVTFSAGIAPSVGRSATTMRLADEALYQAKQAGRDRWVWSRGGDLGDDVTDDPPSHYINPYIDDAVCGKRGSAIRITLDLFDHGISHERVIEELLAAAQREVGERWHRNELTVADEHIATGVSGAALDALVSEAKPSDGDGHTVVTCAEGDWHSLAAQMFGESLHGYGVGVTVLGASMPADYVAEMLARRNADSLAISCSVPTFFPGVARLIDVAHLRGIPVIVGGRAFGGDSRSAECLGADGWALTAREAAPIVQRWRLEPPQLHSQPTPLDPMAMRMIRHAEEIGHSALAGLAARFPPMANYDEQQLARTSEDLVYNVQFLAAAMLVADDAIFTGFLEWLQSLLVNRGVPRHALITGLEVLRPGVESIYPEAVRLLDVGHRQLVDDLAGMTVQ